MLVQNEVWGQCDCSGQVNLINSFPEGQAIFSQETTLCKLTNLLSDCDVQLVPPQMFSV